MEVVINMIIINIQGGLGNQMFEYAFSKQMATLNNSEVYFHEKNWYGLESNVQKRSLELDNFNVSYKRANLFDVVRLRGFASFRILRFGVRQLNKIVRLFKKDFKGFKWSTLIQEQDYGHRFVPELLEKRGSFYIEGFWNSEKFFKGIEDTIRKDFTFKEKPNEEDLKVLDLMKTTDSVSLHIRRGDYTKIKAMQGSADLDYYKRAIEYFKKNLKNIHIFIFSDDIPWVKENLKAEVPVTYVEHNVGKRNYYDMYLMSQSKHNIIANSTFSWWGAWLNSNKNKIVIMPKVWFYDPNENPHDIECEGWIKI